MKKGPVFLAILPLLYVPFYCTLTITSVADGCLLRQINDKASLKFMKTARGLLQVRIMSQNLLAEDKRNLTESDEQSEVRDVCAQAKRCAVRVCDLLL